ncbi:MAG: hypothetical protein IJ392_02775 [Clostridia bacterium]|nr:hypothetical protein [Clostridia bacterium]
MSIPNRTLIKPTNSTQSCILAGDRVHFTTVFNTANITCKPMPLSIVVIISRIKTMEYLIKFRFASRAIIPMGIQVHLQSFYGMLNVFACVFLTTSSTDRLVTVAPMIARRRNIGTAHRAIVSDVPGLGIMFFFIHIFAAALARKPMVGIIKFILSIRVRTGIGRAAHSAITARSTHMIVCIDLLAASFTHIPMHVRIGAIRIHVDISMAGKAKGHIRSTAVIAHTGTFRVTLIIVLKHIQLFATIRAFAPMMRVVRSVVRHFVLRMRTLHIRGCTDLLRVHMPHRTQHIQQKDQCTNNSKTFHPYSPLIFWDFWLNYTAFCTLFQCLSVTRKCVQPVTIMQA